MGKVMELLHEHTDFLFVKLLEIAGPIVLVAQSPNDNRRVIIMLFDHIGQHPTGLCLVYFTAQSTAAPGNFLPYQYTQAIARFQDDTRLLVMPKADEIDTHVFHHPHLVPDHVFRHCRAYASMVFMTMRTPEQQSLTIEIERALFREFEMTEADPLGVGSRVSPCYHGQPQGV